MKLIEYIKEEKKIEFILLITHGIINGTINWFNYGDENDEIVCDKCTYCDDTCFEHNPKYWEVDPFSNEPWDNCKLNYTNAKITEMKNKQLIKLIEEFFNCELKEES